ncbi:MAG TPA: extracellular solute-binding protein [Ktedonosporobacter sp.]|nr:extracellular solute-binding protein [Ktedonosporobacter sp.]
MKRRDFLRSMGATGAVLGLPLSISACGGSSNSGGSSSQTATINWWHIQTGDPGKSNWQNLANQYMKAHPNVSIKITLLENEAFKSKLATDMQSGNPPDLFHSWGGGVLFNFAKAGLVQDLTSALQGDWGSSFNKSALDVYAQNGKNYGIPWDMGAVGFWYNKALFTKAGITTTPTTWSDFLQLVQKLKAAGIAPLALGEKDKWPGMYWWAYLAVRTGGKDAFDKAYNRTGSFADPAFVQAGQHLRELVALDPFQKGSLGAGYTDEITAMSNNKAAMELMGQWAPANDVGNPPVKNPPTLSFFPFPMVEGGTGNPTDVLGGGGGFAIGKNAPPETVDFLKFLTNSQNQQSMAKAGIVLPTVKGLVDAIPNPQMKAVAQLVSQAPYFQLYYDQYLPPALGQAILDATQGLYAGTLTPEAAARAVEDSAATALSK